LKVGEVMNFADVSAGEWIVIVLGILLSIILISGHGKWFIAGYNTSSAEERKRYNSKKLCRTVGVGMAVIVVLTTIHLLFKNVLPTVFEYIMGVIIFADIIIILIFSNTICRK